MPAVELIYDGDCPNVAAARAQLLRAFSRVRVAPHWKEWLGSAADSPEHVRGYGSPTILVDGEDVTGGAHGTGAACCRLYEHPGGEIRGVPSVEAITAALGPPTTVSETSSNGGRIWRLNMAMLPGVGAAFLPKVACPACWPAYAGFLSSVGLGFLLDTTYLLPLTAAFLAVAVGALAYRAKTRRGYLPFALGAIGAAIALIGKFAFESDPAMYAGLTILIGASLWNTWPRRENTTVCPAYTPPESKPNHSEKAMSDKRKIEVFSAGCPACQETIDLVNQVACPSCEVSILNMNDGTVASRAKGLGIRSIPAVVIDGKLVDCSANRGPDEATLRAGGLGQPTA